MDASRAILLATVGLVVLATVLTGPVIGFIQIPAEAEFGSGDIGTGNASMSDVSLPSGSSLRPESAGESQYVLRTADAEVDIASVTGSPILVYKLDIDGLGYSRSSIMILEPGMDGRYSIALSKATVSAEKVQKDSYASELQLILRGDGSDRIIGNRTVTVTVAR